MYEIAHFLKTLQTQLLGRYRRRNRIDLAPLDPTEEPLFNDAVEIVLKNKSIRLLFAKKDENWL